MVRHQGLEPRTHPIWVESQGWTDAQDLETGDLTAGANGLLRVVEETIDYGWLPDQTVYNLSVANVHTFIVGDDDGTVVHNCSGASIWVSQGKKSAAQNAFNHFKKPGHGRDMGYQNALQYV